MRGMRRGAAEQCDRDTQRNAETTQSGHDTRYPPDHDGWCVAQRLYGMQAAIAGGGGKRKGLRSTISIGRRRSRPGGWRSRNEEAPVRKRVAHALLTGCSPVAHRCSPVAHRSGRSAPPTAPAVFGLIRLQPAERTTGMLLTAARFAVAALAFGFWILAERSRLVAYAPGGPLGEGWSWVPVAGWPAAIAAALAVGGAFCALATAAAFARTGSARWLSGRGGECNADDPHGDTRRAGARLFPALGRDVASRMDSRRRGGVRVRDAVGW